MLSKVQRTAQGRVRAGRPFVLGALLLLTVIYPLAGVAQTTTTPEEEYKKLIKVSEDVQPLGQTPFGERIGLYDGSLSFDQADITVPGTGPTITISREFALHGVKDRPDLQNRAFGDWDLDLPQIFTVTANQNNVVGWQVAGQTPNAICTKFNTPPTVAAPRGDGQRADWEPETWWQGYQLRMPGQGSEELMVRASGNTTAPTIPGMSFPLLTKNNWVVGCLGQTSNASPLEGFIAVSPDGTKYWLDHLSYRYMPTLTRPLGSSSVAGRANVAFVAANDFVDRREGRMLVSRIEDRFGNWIKYAYSGDLVYGGDLVTDITASDGRHVSFAYADGGPRISSITVDGGAAGTHTWSYAYTKSVPNLVYSLTTVTRPDNSAWHYNLDPLNGAWPDTRNDAGTCATPGVPTNIGNAFTASITHPSGLSASYTVVPMLHGRSYVFQDCRAGVGIQPVPNLQGTWAETPNASYGMSITQRVLSGAGLPAGGLSWNYTYSSPNRSWTQDCAAGCPTTIYTDVAYPDGHAERSTFSNRDDWTESQLIREEVFDGAPGTNVRQSTAYQYVNPNPAQNALAGGYPHPWGYTMASRVNILQQEEQIPMWKRVITSNPGSSFSTDGYTCGNVGTSPSDMYLWSVSAFDGFSRARDVARCSSRGYAASESSTFVDNTARWVIGLPWQTIELKADGTSETVSENTYNADTATILQRKRFGHLKMSYVFNDAGQLASFTEGDIQTPNGNAHTTSLNAYTFGVPTSITYPDATTQSIGVNGFGQIASVTDQAGSTTSYGYDPLGRVSRIDYPASNPAWAPKTFTYTFSGDARGLGGNHWVTDVVQGSQVQHTDYDVLMRPVMQEKSEQGTGALAVSTRTEYDWAGRKTFESYPVAGAPDRSALTLGVATAYDALGRVVSTTQSSEQGDLTTLTAYLPGAIRQVTDAAGHQTSMSYQVFDQPSFDSVVRVDAPEGVTQVIERDIYGNPTKLVQGGITKTMAYDDEHRLCHTYEPESGHTMTGYDAFDNAIWTASGQATSDTECGYADVAPSATVSSAFDSMNRVTSITYPDSLTTTYVYDARGDVQTTTSLTSTGDLKNLGTVAWAFGRNNLGLLTSESLQIDGWQWLLSYDYDANGVLAAVHYPDGETVASHPNALGQPTSAGTYATGATYQANGDFDSFALGNGILFSSQSNARNVQAWFHYDTATADVLHEDFSYDRVGNIVGIAGLSATDPRQRTMSYDGLSRLVSATASNLWGTESYTYDTLNNIRSLTNSGGTNTYAYDSNNLLSSISNNGVPLHTFAYDARGNTAAKDTKALTFDLANRLLAYADKGQYMMYDASGRRVKLVGASGTTYYAYNSAGQLMWEYNASTADGTDYIYLGKKLVANKRGSVSQVTGAVEGVTNNANAVVSGWACSTGIATSIDVHLYVGGAAGTGTMIAQATANQSSDASVEASCHAGGMHRFTIPITEANRIQYAGKAIYVHGISPVGKDNTLLTNSGTYLVPASILAPLPPASVSAAASGDLSSIAISWPAVSNTTSYTVQQSVNGGGLTTIYTGSGTSTTVNLPADASYQFKVSACNGNGCSNPTSSATVVIAHIPSAPAGINVPGSSNGPVAISWGGASYATSYAVEHSTDGNWTQVFAGGATSTTINEPNSGNWYYRVRACNANGCGGYTTSGVVIVTRPPASAPSIAGGGTSNNGAYTISWSGVAGAASYNLMEAANGAGLVTVQNNGAGSWSTSGRGNGTYIYQVQACNAGGCGPFSGQVAVTVALIPAQPGMPNVVQKIPYYKPTVLVTWNAVAGATRYELLESPDKGGATTVYNGTALTWSSGIKYYTGIIYYAVRACNAVGCSAYSLQGDVGLISGK